MPEGIGEPKWVLAVSHGRGRSGSRPPSGGFLVASGRKVLGLSGDLVSVTDSRISQLRKEQSAMTRRLSASARWILAFVLAFSLALPMIGEASSGHSKGSSKGSSKSGGQKTVHVKE